MGPSPPHRFPLILEETFYHRATSPSRATSPNRKCSTHRHPNCSTKSTFQVTGDRCHTALYFILHNDTTHLGLLTSSPGPAWHRNGQPQRAGAKQLISRGLRIASAPHGETDADVAVGLSPDDPTEPVELSAAFHFLKERSTTVTATLCVCDACSTCVAGTHSSMVPC